MNQPQDKSYNHCDSCVKSVIEKFIERADFGMKKYGTNLDRKDLSILDWVQHAQEEHMDAILYLEKLKQEFQRNQTRTQNVVPAIEGDHFE
jgi:hypothetical protein